MAATLAQNVAGLMVSRPEMMRYSIIVASANLVNSGAINAAVTAPAAADITASAASVASVGAPL